MAKWADIRQARRLAEKRVIRRWAARAAKAARLVAQAELAAAAAAAEQQNIAQVQRPGNTRKHTKSFAEPTRVADGREQRKHAANVSRRAPVDDGATPPKTHQACVKATLPMPPPRPPRSPMRAVPVAIEALADRPASKPMLGRSIGAGYDARAKGLTVWCEQCERMVMREQAQRCGSRFCKAKSAASAPMGRAL